MQAPGLQKKGGEFSALATSLARADWDNFETSWDFADLPLLREGLKGETLEASWNNWDRHLRQNIARMQELETENNRLWIEAYGLQDELTPEVPEDEITLARPGERERDMKAFVSYAVGCMMGRYALDKPGLILADAGDGIAEWEAKVCKPVSEAIFPPDADGVIPVLDEAYFPDDLTERLIAFVRTTFGPERLNENLDYLADALTKRKARETSRDALRRYLATKFYADHVQTSKKRPIYWLFTSGKERAFQALVYLHRYRPDTLARMRTEYLHVVQRHLESEAGHLEREGGDAKKLAKVRAKLSELREFDQKLKHFADRAIPLDLDDGVKVNYIRFFEPGLEIVEPIKGLTDKTEGGDEE
jgi:type II restriction/modification system DNA methylase subunit YeeA